MDFLAGSGEFDRGQGVAMLEAGLDIRDVIADEDAVAVGMPAGAFRGEVPLPAG